MGTAQKNKFRPLTDGYTVEAKVGNRTLNLTVQEVHISGGQGYTKTEVLIIQGTDGAPITVFPRAASVVWVQ
jgi:hypothetical protein